MTERVEITVEWRERTPQQGLPSKWYSETFRQSYEQGRREGRHEAGLDFLGRKFGELPLNFIERTNQIEDDMWIEWVVEQLLIASTLAEIQFEPPNPTATGSHISSHHNGEDA